jgi:PAS domain S-box-containing protein
MENLIGDGEPSDVLAERLTMACLAGGIGVWDWNLLTGVMTYSDLARDIWGLQRQGPVTREMLRERIHPDDLARVQSASERALDPATRAEENFIYRIRKTDSECRWVRAHGIARFAAVDGVTRAVRYTGSIEDITEYETARQALADSEARLRLALEASRMAVWELDLDTDTVTHSPVLNRMLGFPEDARPSAEDMRARYAPGERERLEAEGAEIMARGETLIQSRVRYVLPSGEDLICVLRASLDVDQTKGRRVIGVLFDITKQARAEERLHWVTHELRHRLKNIASLAGIFARQTWAPDENLDVFLGRIRALTLSADLMFGGAKAVLSLHELVERSIEPFRETGCERFRLTLSQDELTETEFTGLALALHELATNASKHGSLSVPAGWVDILASRDPEGLRLTWTEKGGPPVKSPEQTGFGTRLLERGALSPPHSITRRFEPDGLVADIVLRREAGIA